MKNFVYLLFIFFFASTISAQTPVDHSEFIEGPFNSPQEVTALCLECHPGYDEDIMKTRHWNWLGKEFTTPDGRKTRLGKRNMINNFCIAVPSNWPRCTSCHIGYGWKDETFDFNDGTNIDCLICHDHTDTYKKVPTGAGMPDPSVDLVKVAQSVGPTRIENCSICHFNGGGGTGIKHGDMDGSMINPSPELDVHMGKLGFTCSDCHAGMNHEILGAGQASMVAGRNHISCLSCHGDTPHRRKIVNDHVQSVACETCHIPAFAREEPTKVWWDWSTAGERRDPIKDEFGMPDYDRKKGDFKWDKNVIPEYRWFTGQTDYYLYGDIIKPREVITINKLIGSFDNPRAKITPFKLMRGKQPYDARNDYLVVAKLFGKGGYWDTYDWDDAAELGMQTINLDFSGRLSFVETEMYWPINHMVAPAGSSLRCTDCHSKRGPRRLDWEAMGYDGDPMLAGGRFTQ